MMRSIILPNPGRYFTARQAVRAGFSWERLTDYSKNGASRESPAESIVREVADARTDRLMARTSLVLAGEPRGNAGAQTITLEATGSRRDLKNLV